MDATSITLGTETRDRLKEYKENNDCYSYNEALNRLLEESENT